MSKVLLVVDMQEICVGEKHAKIFQYEDDLIEKVNEVIALNKNNIVIYIRNVMKKNLVNKCAPFKAYEGREQIKLVKSLNVVSDFCFDKYEGDAFSNKELVEFCEEKQVKEIEVKELAHGTGISKNTIDNYLSGQKSIPNAENAVKIAKFLGISTPNGHGIQ